MSRIGKKPIALPEGVTVTVVKKIVTVKGPKGELSQEIDDDLSIEVKDKELVVVRSSDQKRQKAMHGLYRSLIGNMVIGVYDGYSIDLQLVGVGYKATCANNVLELNLGYSHGIYFALPPEVVGNAINQKGKDPIIKLESIDKQLIGQVAAKLRSLRRVEPYKGKGIRFVGEQIRRKEGKAAAK